MSEVNEGAKKRDPYKINIENDPFNPIGEYKLITSTELGQLASSIFKSAFADFEGVIFEPGNGAEPTFSLIFNHGKYNDDEIVGVKRSIDTKADGDDVISLMRHRDRLGREGDKYLITDDGKDVIEQLLTPAAYNSGKPRWNQIVSEFSESQGYYYNPQVPQYTKISQISLKRLVTLIYGYKDAITNDIYDYEVRIVGATGAPSPNMPASSYMLQISRASTNEVNNTYRKLGYSIASSNIIRS